MSTATPRILVFAALATIAGGVAGCGQKGPLTLPPAPTSQSKPQTERPAERPARPFPDVPATNESK